MGLGLELGLGLGLGLASCGCQCERVWKKATPLDALTQQRGWAAQEHALEAELSSRPPPKAARLNSRSTSLGVGVGLGLGLGLG